MSLTAGEVVVAVVEVGRWAGGERRRGGDWKREQLLFGTGQKRSIGWVGKKYGDKRVPFTVFRNKQLNWCFPVDSVNSVVRKTIFCGVSTLSRQSQNHLRSFYLC